MAEAHYLSYRVLLHYNAYTRVFSNYRTYWNDDTTEILHNDIMKPVLELTGV